MAGTLRLGVAGALREADAPDPTSEQPGAFFGAPPPRFAKKKAMRNHRTPSRSQLGDWKIRSESGILVSPPNSFEIARQFMRATSLLILLAGLAPALLAQDKPATEKPATKLVPLNEKKTILLDKPGGRVLLKTKICLKEGVLEMLACPRQTKEHESILSFDGEAHLVHAALLALGAEPGGPAKFQPKYVPPQGQTIDIFINWKDADGQDQRVPAQRWIRHATMRYFEFPLEKVPEGVVIERKEDSLRYDEFNKYLIWFGTMTKTQREKFLAMSEDKDYQKAVKSLYEQGQPREMKADFVFVGSKFAKLDDGTERYLAQDGSLICVANFSDAMIDINVKSSADNAAGLTFEPWTERLPDVETEVTLELIPRGLDKANEKKEDEE
ncbi:MAG: hypothetical protein KDA36_05680 [Planctomycetaceae bacterium]|nr:hypothetical protein [Planctomycetaceae bacterium]MCA9097851.1 hypothetical protein [Planctomycetaceae bacterium]